MITVTLLPQTLEDVVRQHPQCLSLEGTKLSVVGKQISSIGHCLPPSIAESIRTLYISNNNLNTLQGIDKYNHLRIVSCANNYIRYMDDLKYIKNIKFLEKVSFIGNPVTMMPFYREYLISLCPNLVSIDGKNISLKEKMDAKTSSQKAQLFYNQLRLNALRNCILGHIKNLVCCHFELQEVVIGRFRSILGAHVASSWDAEESFHKMRGRGVKSINTDFRTIDSNKSSSSSLWSYALGGNNTIEMIIRQTLIGGTFRWLCINSSDDFDKTTQDLAYRINIVKLKKLDPIKRVQITSNTGNYLEVAQHWENILYDCLDYQNRISMELITACTLQNNNNNNNNNNMETTNVLNNINQIFFESSDDVPMIKDVTNLPLPNFTSKTTSSISYGRDLYANKISDTTDLRAKQTINNSTSTQYKPFDNIHTYCGVGEQCHSRSHSTSPVRPQQPFQVRSCSTSPVRVKYNSSGNMYEQDENINTTSSHLLTNLKSSVPNNNNNNNNKLKQKRNSRRAHHSTHPPPPLPTEFYHQGQNLFPTALFPYHPHPGSSSSVASGSSNELCRKELVELKYNELLRQQLHIKTHNNNNNNINGNVINQQENKKSLINYNNQQSHTTPYHLKDMKKIKSLESVPTSSGGSSSSSSSIELQSLQPSLPPQQIEPELIITQTNKIQSNSSNNFTFSRNASEQQSIIFDHNHSNNNIATPPPSFSNNQETMITEPPHTVIIVPHSDQISNNIDLEEKCYQFILATDIINQKFVNGEYRFNFSSYMRQKLQNDNSSIGISIYTEKENDDDDDNDDNNLDTFIPLPVMSHDAFSLSSSSSPPNIVLEALLAIQRKNPSDMKTMKEMREYIDFIMNEIIKIQRLEANITHSFDILFKQINDIKETTRINVIKNFNRYTECQQQQIELNQQNLMAKEWIQNYLPYLKEIGKLEDDVNEYKIKVNETQLQIKEIDNEKKAYQENILQIKSMYEKVNASHESLKESIRNDKFIEKHLRSQSALNILKELFRKDRLRNGSIHLLHNIFIKLRSRVRRLQAIKLFFKNIDSTKTLQTKQKTFLLWINLYTNHKKSIIIKSWKHQRLIDQSFTVWSIIYFTEKRIQLHLQKYIIKSLKFVFLQLRLLLKWKRKIEHDNYHNNRLLTQFFIWKIFNRWKNYSKNCQQISGLEESRKTSRAMRFHKYKLFCSWQLLTSQNNYFYKLNVQKIKSNQNFKQLREIFQLWIQSTNVVKWYRIRKCAIGFTNIKSYVYDRNQLHRKNDKALKFLLLKYYSCGWYQLKTRTKYRKFLNSCIRRIRSRIYIRVIIDTWAKWSQTYLELSLYRKKSEKAIYHYLHRLLISTFTTWRQKSISVAQAIKNEFTDLLFTAGIGINNDGNDYDNSNDDDDQLPPQMTATSAEIYTANTLQNFSSKIASNANNTISHIDINNDDDLFKELKMVIPSNESEIFDLDSLEKQNNDIKQQHQVNNEKIINDNHENLSIIMNSKTNNSSLKNIEFFESNLIFNNNIQSDEYDYNHYFNMTIDNSIIGTIPFTNIHDHLTVKSIHQNFEVKKNLIRLLQFWRRKTYKKKKYFYIYDKTKHRIQTWLLSKTFSNFRTLYLQICRRRCMSTSHAVKSMLELSTPTGKLQVEQMSNSTSICKTRIIELTQRYQYVTLCIAKLHDQFDETNKESTETKSNMEQIINQENDIINQVTVCKEKIKITQLKIEQMQFALSTTLASSQSHLLQVTSTANNTTICDTPKNVNPNSQNATRDWREEQNMLLHDVGSLYEQTVNQQSQALQVETKLNNVMKESILQLENHKNYSMELDQRITTLLQERQNIQTNMMKTTQVIDHTLETISKRSRMTQEEKLKLLGEKTALSVKLEKLRIEEKSVMSELDRLKKVLDDMHRINDPNIHEIPKQLAAIESKSIELLAHTASELRVNKDRSIDQLLRTHQQYYHTQLNTHNNKDENIDINKDKNKLHSELNELKSEKVTDKTHIVHLNPNTPDITHHTKQTDRLRHMILHTQPRSYSPSSSSPSTADITNSTSTTSVATTNISNYYANSPSPPSSHTKTNTELSNIEPSIENEQFNTNVMKTPISATHQSVSNSEHHFPNQNLSVEENRLDITSSSSAIIPLTQHNNNNNNNNQPQLRLFNKLLQSNTPLSILLTQPADTSNENTTRISPTLQHNIEASSVDKIHIHNSRQKLAGLDHEIDEIFGRIKNRLNSV